MTVNDILTLAESGFTAQQITAIIRAFQPPAPAPTPAPAPAPTPMQDPNMEILSKLGIISQQISGMNIAGSQQPAQQTPDDILATIIAPPMAQKGGAN